MHQCIEIDKDEASRSSSNIFKMSRVLVVEKKKVSKTQQVEEELSELKKKKKDLKPKDYEEQRDQLKYQIENADLEYNYEESSDENDEDSDVEEARSKYKKPQQEY